MFLINDNPFPYRLFTENLDTPTKNRLTENSIFRNIDSPELRFIEESKIRSRIEPPKICLIEIQKNIFSWNETLTYSEKFGQMTYLSQTLLISDITVDYAEYDESMQFRMISNMFPSGEYECPR